MKRIVCWFSCGAASAVATKIAIRENNNKLPLVIVYTKVLEEHKDNIRFLADCENWFGQKITVLKNEKHNASIYEVFERERFLVSPYGAACTRLLKKEVRKQFEHPNDIQVFGYTVEEKARVDRFIDANNEVNLSTPLIEHHLTKNDCLAMLQNADIELPQMYRLGYKNINCIGCVKGGVGYWNKIRVDFPEVFERMAKTEELLGRTVCKLGGERIPLRELPVNAGRYQTESSLSCGIFCELSTEIGLEARA